MFAKALAVVLGLAASVAAHGYVQELTFGTTKYTGYLPYTDPYYSPPPPRIVRFVDIIFNYRIES